MPAPQSSNAETVLSTPSLSTTEAYQSITGDQTTLYIGSDESLGRYDITAQAWTKLLGVGCVGLDRDPSGVVWCASQHAIYRDLSPTPELLLPAITFTALHVVGSDVYAVGRSGAIWHRHGID